MPNPSCKATQAGFQIVPTNTWTVAVLDTALWDLNGDLDLANNRIKLTKDGYYLVTGQGVIQDLGDGSKLLVGIFVNGTQRAQNRFTVGGTDVAGVGVAALLKLNKDDLIECRLYHNHGSNRNWYGGEDGRSLGLHFLL